MHEGTQQLHIHIGNVSCQSAKGRNLCGLLVSVKQELYCSKNSYCFGSKRWEESVNFVKSMLTISRVQREDCYFIKSSHFQVSKDFIIVQQRNGWLGALWDKSQTPD